MDNYNAIKKKAIAERKLEIQKAKEYYKEHKDALLHSVQSEIYDDIKNDCNGFILILGCNDFNKLNKPKYDVEEQFSPENNKYIKKLLISDLKKDYVIKESCDLLDFSIRRTYLVHERLNGGIKLLLTDITLSIKYIWIAVAIALLIRIVILLIK